jgi:hypothetical protein
MTKSLLAIGIGILITGLIAGMLFGVGVKTGISPTEGGIALTIMKSFCQATEGIDGAMAFNCWGYLVLMTVVVLFIGVIDVLLAAASIGDWRIGLAIYFIGWFIGLVMLVAT